MNWLQSLPWWISTSLSIGGACMLTFANRLPPEYQNIGLLISLGVFSFGSIALLFHLKDKNKSSLVALIELREMAKKQGWDFISGKSLHIIDFTDAFRQAGLDGLFIIKGRPNRNMSDSLNEAEPLHVIPQDHWKDFQVETSGLLQANENIDARTYNMRSSGSWHQGGYIDLHAEKQKAIAWLKTDARQFMGRRK